jgi:hypothetical protein
MTIVRSHYRYKRPPKRKKAVPLEGPAVLIIAEKTRRRVSDEAHVAPAESTPAAPAVISTSSRRAGASAALPANGDRKPAVVTAKPPKPVPSSAPAARPSAIVTARRPGKRYADVPEVDEAEHRRVGDLADAMMQEFRRVITEKTRK